MGAEFTPAEKREVIEHFIVQWRLGRASGIEGERDTYLILKAIAADYRAQEPARKERVLIELSKLVDLADIHRDPATKNYTPGRLQRVAHFVMGSWPVIRKALEQFKQTEGA